MAKTSDFFIGVIDFFAILMPGALLTFLLLPWGASGFGGALPGLNLDAEKWLAFGISSYILGHFLHHVGSILDWLYKELYEKKLKTKYCDKKLGDKTTELMNQSLPGAADMTLPFSWAGSYVRLKSSAAGNELDRSALTQNFLEASAL